MPYLQQIPTRTEIMPEKCTANHGPEGSMCQRCRKNVQMNRYTSRVQEIHMEPPVDYMKLMLAHQWWNRLPEITKVAIFEDLGEIDEILT